MTGLMVTGALASTPINYFSRASYEKLGLIQGEGDVFRYLLKLLSDYEGVLARQESLAVNLGAKLTGPRLIKALESTFEGPIITSPPQTAQTPHPVRWTDIIHYARSNPSGFTTVKLPGGVPVCQFHLHGMQVEVMEEDWRLIATGALDGMIPTGPMEEDEAAELATVDILEARLEVLIQTAEEVARRAKKLVYALNGRRSAVVAQRGKEQHQQHQQQHPPSVLATGFQAVNRRKRKNSVREGIGGDMYDLHADLLQQFSSPLPSPNMYARSIYTIQTGQTPGHISVSAATGPSPSPVGSAYPISLSPVARYPPIAPSGRLPTQPPATPRRDSAAEDAEALHRPLITGMIETLGKGDEIIPPCDRCRRLRVECVKHLTACQGCTKKHAKCTWKTATEEEITELRHRKEMRKRAAKKAAEGSHQGVCGITTGVGPGGAAGGGDGGVRRNERSETKLPGIQHPPPPPPPNQSVPRQDLVTREIDEPAPPHSHRPVESEESGQTSTYVSHHHIPKASGAGNAEETAPSRMDIDSITTQMSSPPRGLLPTGLPRDPNFLSTPVKEVGMKEVRAMPATTGICNGEG
ncbi:hypothetical protein jhhlp_001394 [Lomentospora prolificans]|uniref:Zn(2)-C6 fungal-type domain-containing protein n=1 Tax=Lomentospora prolificans TaxID=41688 RepID=A0A2N3NI32_9PEZI|nr:hypothetical protein jhhlp_001394 [Lomentospora prolificans]